MNYASRLRTTSPLSSSSSASASGFMVASPMVRCLWVMILAATAVMVRLGSTSTTAPLSARTTTTVTTTTKTNRQQHHASRTEFTLARSTAAAAAGAAQDSPPAPFSHREGGSKLVMEQQQQQQQQSNPLALSCATVEQHALSGAWYDPLRGQPNLIRRVLDYPYYYISLHSRQYDVVRHKSLYVQGRYYEHTVMQRFHTILGNNNKNNNPQQQPPSSPGIVLDVGANVGVYTLLSAGLGHTVHAFEINPANLIRLCESVWINGFDNSNNNGFVTNQVQIYQRGVSAQTGIPLRLVVPHNPGQAHLVPTTTTTTRTSKQQNDDATVVTVETLSLDDWATVQGWLPPLNATSTTTTTVASPPPNILLLKMDVEGVEPAVVAGAVRLLRTGWIHNVLTEVKEMSRPTVQTMLRTLFDCGYVLMLPDDNDNDDTPARPRTREESQQYLQRLQKQTRATWYRKDVTVDLWFQLLNRPNQPNE